MEENINEKVEQIYDYLQAIFQFEEFVKKIYNNYDWNLNYDGYIIKLKDYQNFKDNIFYDIIVKYNSSSKSCKNKIKEFIDSGKINEIKKIDKVIIRTEKELIDLIKQKNEYKLISMELGNIICKNLDNNKRFYIYLIETFNIIIYLDIDEAISLNCNNNIINENSYTINNNSKLLHIAKSIIEYNKFENKIIGKLKNKNLDEREEIEDGYLIEKKWIDEWKKLLNYENIDIGIENEEQINEIIKQISSKYINQYKIKQLFKDIKIFSSKKDIEDYNKYNSLAIINKPFNSLINENYSEKNKIFFTASNEIITVYIKQEKMIFNSCDNIIESKNETFEILEDSSHNKINNEEKKVIANEEAINDIKDFENLNQPKINLNNNIINNFRACPNIGLQNIGATCYMNATLQCFCHIEKFVNFFKYNPQIDKIKNGNNLSSSFKILIENLWPKKYEKIFKNDKINKNEYYAPEEFKKKISKMNSLFEGIAANDSKDLVNFIIMTLHKELHKPNKNIENNNNIFIDQSNQQMVFNNFAKDFMSKNQSIISDLFYGINCNITECLNCHNKLYNYQTYFFLIFSLEEVRKFNIQKYFNNNQFNFNNNFIIYNNMNNNAVNIYDCFDYDRKINIMSGSNSMYCNNCKINCKGSMYTYLSISPEILILLLNRGKGKQFDVKIYFEEKLNLYKYIEYKNTGFNYRLIGVITHIGESSMNGHFIAYCRDPITEKWFKYNDAIVSEINNFNEIINFAMPYILFYQKI